MAEIKNYTINFSSDITFAQQKLVSTEIYREPAMVRMIGME